MVSVCTVGYFLQVGGQVTLRLGPSNRNKSPECEIERSRALLSKHGGINRTRPIFIIADFVFLEWLCGDCGLVVVRVNITKGTTDRISL